MPGDDLDTGGRRAESCTERTGTVQGQHTHLRLLDGPPK